MFEGITKNHINVLYKIFGILNFISSILAIFFVKADFWDRILGFIGVNMIFLMFYLFYKDLINYQGKGNLAWPIFGKPMKLIFGLFSIFGSFFIIYILTQIIVQYDEKELFFLICVPASLFLGGATVLISLRDEN